VGREENQKVEKEQKEDDMNTLFDFVTHIKGVEYVASLTFIALYLVFTEFLKEKPFRSLFQAGRDDVDYLKTSGSDQAFQSVKRVVSAPFIGLAYIVALPFVFLYAVVGAATRGILAFAGKEMPFGWRPLEAYLSGKQGEKKENKESAEEEKKS
jgi:hypothetical protein